MSINSRAKNVAKAILNNVSILSKKTYKPRIIYYHSINTNLPLSHNPETLERHLKWLSENNYTGLRLSELPCVIQEPNFESKRYVLITFDDGYADNVDIGLPILNSYGFKATFFVVAGMVHEKTRSNSDMGHMLYPGRQMMTYGDLRKLTDCGMEVGSHGWTHQQTTRIDKGSRLSLAGELEKSRQLLEEIINHPVLSFSYPNGQRGAFSQETRNQIIQAGYHCAATTMWGTLCRSADLFSLPRCEITVADSTDEFEKRMTGRRDYLCLISRLMDRSKVWDSNVSFKPNRRPF
jgi:peptidoglycan/xylan/chitin deacetylase (PgdA/CDA1 family)